MRISEACMLKKENIVYSRNVIKINGKGAKERIIKDEKWPVPFVGYRVKGGQFIYSRIDARNGAFAIIPNYLNNAVVSKDFPIFDIDYNKIKPDILLFSLTEIAIPLYFNMVASCAAATVPEYM